MMLKTCRVLWVICMSSFVKCVFRSFLSLNIELLVLLAWRNSSYSFLQKSFAPRTRTRSVQSEAHLLIVPEELLILIKFISSISLLQYVFLCSKFAQYKVRHISPYSFFFRCYCFYVKGQQSVLSHFCMWCEIRIGFIFPVLAPLGQKSAWPCV